jgi:HTH-type transcriptional regulator, sugar sensing transcriptional regulator
VDCDLLIFCRNPEFLSLHRSEIKKHKPSMIIVDDAEKFEGLGWDLRELRPECIEMFYGWTGDDSSFIPDCVMVKVGKESLVIGKTGQDIMAIIMKLPIVTMLQKTLLQSLIMPQNEDED